MTLQELVLTVADWAGSTLNIPLQDSEAMIEDMLPTAIQVVARKAAGDPRSQPLLRRNFTVSLANGTGAVSENALVSCWPGATVYVPSEPTVGPLMSYCPNWNDFISGTLDSRLGYWTFQSDDTIYWIDPGATFDITSGRSGNITMNIASVPSIPTSQTDTIDMPDELLSNLVAYLKDMVTGKINPKPDDA